MKLRSANSIGIGVCLTLLALSAAGQTNTGASSHAAMAPSKAATADMAASETAGKPAAAPTTTATKHHAKAHHQKHATHASTGAASTGNQEMAYRAALKNCVAGPAAQRERCLDDSIARFGRS